MGSVLGSGGTGAGSRGAVDGAVIGLSLTKECPPVGGHSLVDSLGPLFVHLLVGLLRRRLAGRLLLGLLLLALLLLPLLALALLLIAILRGLLLVAVFLVHRWPSMVLTAPPSSTPLFEERSLVATGCRSVRCSRAARPQDVGVTT
jgi:hypothetical protein